MLYHTELTSEYLDSLELKSINTNKGVSYFNIEASLDIETTSTSINGEKMAFSYIWMFGIKYTGNVYYGRTWDELLSFLEKIQTHLNLHSKNILTVYVHNLGYEFQFMRKYFTWNNIFAIADRKPVKALCSLGIEFKDSYILSGYSLENTAKNLAKHKVSKMVGDLDYSKIRHQNTKMTETELGYCKNDIVVVLAYINEQIEQYKDITKIPLTNTGRVRKYVKDSCYYTSKSHKKSSKSKYIKYSKIMQDLTLDLDTYKQLKRAFMGGFTHSNPMLTNTILEDVDSVDLSSSYPTVMLSDKYPMSRGRPLKIETIAELKKAMKKYCLVFDLKLINVSNKLGYESYISESKCTKLNKPILNNGRVYSADEIQITITDVDFNIIEAVYSWETIAISNITGFVKNYLPKSIIESILKLYKDKTELKDVKGYEVEYLLSKGMLNSVYGMCVTDFIKDDHTYTDGWNTEPVDPKVKIDEYNKSKSRFLYYPWGIWVTAYARRNLWSAIINVGEDYIYSDTDSVKMLNFKKHTKYIEAYNERVGIKLSEMMQYYKLDESLLSPKTIKGVVKPLGVWDYEGKYTKFKTLGAKRYLVEEDNKLKLTLAGLSKKNGVNYMSEICETNTDVFNIFNDNLYIPKEKTGKMTHTYIDAEIGNLIEDYNGEIIYVNSLSSIHLENCEFTLSVSDQYKNFLSNLLQGYIYKGQQNL